MKSIDQVISNYKSETIDGRDINRLLAFVPEDRFKYFGVEIADEFKGKHIPKEWNRENILEQLEGDVEFAFEKALDKRGLSAEAMHGVIMMWNWILEEGLEDCDSFKYYGLPLFKETAIKYGFENPIGDDKGNEKKYSSDGE